MALQKSKQKNKGKTYTCTVKVKQSKTANKKARKAFKKYLKSEITEWSGWGSTYKTTDMHFITMDVGKNKVPIMLVANYRASHAEGYVGIYQYVNGKVKAIAFYGSFPAVYKEAGVVVLEYSQSGYYSDDYYKFTSTKSKGKLVASINDLVCTDDAQYYYDYDGPSCTKNGKNVSKSTFKKYVSSLTSGSSKNKKIESNFIKNTKKNRNSYFG